MASPAPGLASSRSFKLKTGKSAISLASGLSDEGGKKDIGLHIRVSERIVNNNFFIFVTTVLTAYALVGDDIRLIATNASADDAFNCLVLLCVIVFAAEIIVSCLGQADYMFGFFFWLDVFSTASLVLDLTWVADRLFNGVNDSQSGGGDTSNMRSGRTARLGAKAGRVVRVIRLVRILKLYKHYNEAAARKNRKKAQEEEDDDEEWDEEDYERVQEAEEAPASTGESRVGRKLSDITTRRVVCLILAMLLTLPNLKPEAADETPRSADYGADDILMAFQAAESGMGAREDYQQALLRFLYYHNWFAGNHPETYCPSGQTTSMGLCAEAYYGHLFWVGISGSSPQVVTREAEAARLNASAVSDWASRLSQMPGEIYSYGSIPVEVQAALSLPWDVDCDSATRARRGISLLSRELQDTVGYTVRCPQDLRFMESVAVAPRRVTLQQHDNWHFEFHFDVRPYIRTDAQYNLLVTLFVLVLLIVGTMLFSHDANVIILRPVEKMVQTVEAIRDNPLAARQMADDEFRAEEVSKALLKRDSARVKKILRDLVMCNFCDAAAVREPLETVILEKTIIKLGSLLALGFGEAGANIIAHNMRGRSSAGIKAMVPGIRVNTIIGVAKVRDFSVATEVLQGGINAFCNQIAEIVHGICNEYHGAPNRNNGDSFLIIWRLDNDLKSKRNMRMAEMSVVAFATILGCVHQSRSLADYRRHPAMMFRLGYECVNLCFGLHAGWAIEGAVGSEFKIDASYLSPHVSVAHSIEQATESYGISFIVSDSVVELGCSQLGTVCRLMDRVSIAGSSRPLSLYCVDLDHTQVEMDTSKAPKVVWNTRQRFKVRQHMETEKKRLLDPDLNVVDLFRTDPVIATMRAPYTAEFFEMYKMGFQNYAEGEWHVAQRILMYTRSLLANEDGPSWSLLKYMEDSNYEAPKNWQGVRMMDVEQAMKPTTDRRSRRSLIDTVHRRSMSVDPTRRVW